MKESRQFVTLIQSLFTLFFILFATTAIAGKPVKSPVCHVGNEEGPLGEVYDPDCIPADTNGYFCPTAGKIDLLMLPKPEKHLENSSHQYAGTSDYDPLLKGASGYGNEDSDGNGIDDGCEIPQVSACPCWSEDELLSITKENLLGCSIYGLLLAIIESKPGTTYGAEGGFYANYSTASCATRDFRENGAAPISDEEFDACFMLIVDHCAELLN